MKMRIKKYFLPCFLPVITVLSFVLPAPAFADMKKVDEVELARANASVTGASVPADQIIGVEKGAVSPETWKASGTNTGDAVLSPPVSTESAFLSLNINGQETFKFGITGVNSTVTGGVVTSAKMH
jgi:hypothetical protein